MHSDQAAFMHAIYAARRQLPHGQRPTDAHVRVLFLATRFPPNRTPTHERLAAIAHVHRNTVVAAFMRAHQLGLLSWRRVLVRGLGWVRRAANRYSFMSEAPLQWLTVRSPVEKENLIPLLRTKSVHSPQARQPTGRPSAKRAARDSEELNRQREQLALLFPLK